MAANVGYSEKMQRKIADESRTATQESVGERYGIKKGTICYYRSKFGITESPAKKGRPRIEKAEHVVTNSWMFAGL